MSMRCAGRRPGARGFTLIELAITIVIVGMIAGVFLHYVNEGTRMFQQVDARRELTAQARAAVLRTLREVRQVRSATDVILATPAQFQFYGVDDSLYAIAWDGTPGGTVSFSRGGVSAALSARVDSLAFTYFRSDGMPAVPTVSPLSTDIHRVGIYVRLRSGGDVVAVRSATYLRNVP